ncbi:hypothetical protein QTO30_01450 [Yoonia sp. GPGPB17]|uniref:hypothetical protein n=1 Tax=Yoonia sp. GPGPB17 TaxID=3026147 RepID=UPI0030C2AA7D
MRGFHRLGQVPDLEDMLKTLTSIKFASGVSASDAGKLAKAATTRRYFIRVSGILVRVKKSVSANTVV